MNCFVIAFLTVIFTAAVAMPAQAQDNQLHPDRLGSLYLSAAEGSYVGHLGLYPGDFTFYLIADIDFADIGEPGQNVWNGIGAWEALITLPPDPNLFILSDSYTYGIDIGDKTGNLWNYIVGTGVNLQIGGPTTLVTFEAVATSFLFGQATVSPSVPASYEGEVVWREFVAANGCSLNGAAEKCIFRFETLGDLELRWPKSDDAESFGSVKARF